MSADDVTLAEARVAEARARLDGTVERLQTELEPRRLARVALAEVTDGGERVARVGADAARRNPGLLAGGAGLLAAVVVGRGIALVPEGRRLAIFDLEESTKPRAAGLARGYGLTLVRRVVERLGGSAAVEASPLGGARFTATLPVARREVPA